MHKCKGRTLQEYLKKADLKNNNPVFFIGLALLVQRNVAQDFTMAGINIKQQSPCSPSCDARFYTWMGQHITACDKERSCWYQWITSVDTECQV